MSRGRFLNQKLGKRTDRKSQLLKARLQTQHQPKNSKGQHGPSTPKKAKH